MHTAVVQRERRDGEHRNGEQRRDLLITLLQVNGKREEICSYDTAKRFETRRARQSVDEASFATWR